MYLMGLFVIEDVYFTHSSDTIPVTLNGGWQMPAWFDIHGLSINSQEDIVGAKRAALMGKFMYEIILSSLDFFLREREIRVVVVY